MEMSIKQTSKLIEDKIPILKFTGGDKLIGGKTGGSLFSNRYIINKIKEPIIEDIIGPELDNKFTDLCRIGNLEEAKKMEVNNENYINGFYIACTYGQFEIVKWIYSLKSEECFYINFPFAFANSCKSGNIDLVKWLYDQTSPNLEHYKHSVIYLLMFDILGNTYNTELYKNERKKFIHYKNDLPFYNALLNGHIEIVKWLYSLEDTDYNITHYIENTNLFIFACDCGFFSIAEWLIKVYNKKYPIITDNNFEYICENNIINIAELFVSMSDNYYFEIEDAEIVDWSIGNFIYI